MSRASLIVMRDRHVVLSQMAEAGWNREEAASATGLSYSKVVEISLSSGIAFQRKNAAAPKKQATMQDRKHNRIARLRALAEVGKTRKEVAEDLGLSYGALARFAKKYGVSFTHASCADADTLEKNKTRADAMARLYMDGHTLKQIGFRYGLTRERVRQIIKELTAVTRHNGGGAVKAKRRRDAVERKRSELCFDKNGCSLEERAAMEEVARDMEARGVNKYRTPLFAFRSQRNAAKQRGIEWKLSLWQWWQIWVKSGLWEQRGRGHGYVMCRRGDVGPYALNNVFIATGAENSSMAHKKDNGLPIGVRKNKKYAGYSANKMIGGKTYRLGSFSTVEAAQQAYISFQNGAH